MNVVQKQWNDKADEWMQFARDENSYWSRRLRAIVGLARRHIAAGRSLDVGCGPGLMVRLFTEAGFEAHGADLSENMIDRAAEILAPCVAAPRARLHWCPDGHPPPPPDGQPFDLITAIGILEYITDRRGYIRELTERLAPGGILVLANTNNIRSLFISLAVGSRILRFWPTREWGETIRNLARTGIWSGGHIDYPNADWIYSADALDGVARELGLTVLDGMDLFNFSWLDRDPLNRGPLMRRLARRWGWNHIGVYRKPEATASP